MKRVLLSLAVGSLLLAACGVARLAGKDSPADVGGIWEMLTRGPQGDFTGDLVIRQDASAIHGTVETNFGDGPIAGKVKGTTIQFDATLAMQEGTIDVNYSGTVSGDRMKGTYKAADTEGTWSAVRQRSGQ
jgi:hypothetical protein